MAFNYAKDHVRYAYNKIGQKMPCESVDDEARAKEAGFTSFSYVKSLWPTTAYNKITGESKQVGKLEWDEARNAAAVAALGPDWGLDPVTIEVKAPRPAGSAEASGDTLSMLVNLLSEVKMMREQMADVETAVAELSAARVSQESRLAELEAEMEPETVPAADEKKKK